MWEQAACVTNGKMETSKAILDMFLDNGVDINALHTSTQTTALMKACAGASQLVPHLIAQGAHVTASDVHGNTPLQYVAGGGGW